jgi:hypothetical protein
MLVISFVRLLQYYKTPFDIQKCKHDGTKVSALRRFSNVFATRRSIQSSRDNTTELSVLCNSIISAVLSLLLLIKFHNYYKTSALTLILILATQHSVAFLQSLVQLQTQLGKYMHVMCVTLRVSSVL